MNSKNGVADEHRWSETISFVTKAVVNVKGRTTTSFIDSSPGSWQGTGFIINKSKGLIMTNRHILKPGPCSMKVVFFDREEIEASMVYRDPTHDFAIMQFNVPDVRTETINNLNELQLFPQGAKIGTAIKIIGNDAGEKMQILSGTIARLDRNTPKYSGIYHDHNTFYIGAASSTSGGSSGSPVVDIEGKVVALNAGGSTKAASSFYLPLDRVTRAVDLLNKDLSVTRGTIQSIFKVEDFSVIRRFGLTSEEEMKVREYVKTQDMEELNGMLRVSKLIKQGSGEKAGLLVDDILLKINNEIIVQFAKMEAILDECIEIKNDVEINGVSSKKYQMYIKNNKLEGLMKSENEEIEIKIRMVVNRAGKEMELIIPVQDLNALMPKEFYKISHGTFHEVSYDIAAWGNLPTGLVYACSNSILGYTCSFPARVVIKSVQRMTAIKDEEFETTKKFDGDFKDFVSMQEFLQVMIRCEFGEKLLIKFVYLKDPKYPVTAAGYFSMGINDIEKVSYLESEKKWNSTTIRKYQAPKLENFQPIPETLKTIQNTGEIKSEVFGAMVSVRQTQLDGSSGTLRGIGIVVDKLNGLILCMKTFVASSFKIIDVSIAAETTVPARILYVHPGMNYTLLQIDIVALYEKDNDLAMGLKEMKISDQLPTDSENLLYFGLALDEKRLFDGSCNIKYSSRTGRNSNTRTTRVFIMNKQQVETIGGVYCKENGEATLVCAARFKTQKMTGDSQCFLLSSMIKEIERINLLVKQHEISEVNDRLRFVFSEETATKLHSLFFVHSLGLSVNAKVLSAVRDSHNISNEWVKKLTTKIALKGLPTKLVLEVGDLMLGSPAEEVLKHGDILLAFNDEPVVEVDDFENLIRNSYSKENETFSIIVQRNGKEEKFLLGFEDNGLFHEADVVSFEGMNVTKTMPWLRFSSYCPDEGKEGKGVYIFNLAQGSRAREFRFKNNVWITKVDGERIRTIEEFKEALIKLTSKDQVMFSTIDSKEIKKNLVMKLPKDKISIQTFKRDLQTLSWTVNKDEFPKK